MSFPTQDVLELFLTEENYGYLASQLPKYSPVLVKKWARKWNAIYSYDEDRLQKPTYQVWGNSGKDSGGTYYDVTKDLAGLNARFINEYKDIGSRGMMWEEGLVKSMEGPYVNNNKPSLQPFENPFNGKLWRHLQRKHYDILSHKDAFESEATEYEHVLYRQQEPNKTYGWLSKYGKVGYTNPEEIKARCRRPPNPW